MLRVLTIDDNSLFLQVFNDLLARFPDVSVIASARNGTEGLMAAADMQPDVVFVDVKMPDINGLEVSQNLRTRSPDTRIVVMSLLDDDECREGAARAGADCYVGKWDLFNRLPAILEKAAQRREVAC